MDVGCHVVDRIDYLFGPLVAVTGGAENRNSPSQDVEDRIRLRGTIGTSDRAAVYSAGAAVDCTWDFGWTGEPLDELVVTGPGGSVSMAGMSPSLPITVKGADGEVLRELLFDAPEHTAQPMIQEVVDCLLRGSDEGSTVVSTAANAIRTSSVLDTVLESYYGGRNDTFWERPESWPGRSK
mmetsp:Transcript_23216/g.46336  ORF Transcript_23216/g.46336 Transcript_23216/m.46336 type:complete len:181 (+) Transcript_23216:791-1333(+)